MALRFIPAGAGNTPRSVCPCTHTSVHPRWRGEHPRSMILPRPTDGSSPLARGTPISAGQDLLGDRFIPAGAGNTARMPQDWFDETVHPRWRGEHMDHDHDSRWKYGSSPLARGTLGSAIGVGALLRFIPAGAGNTSSSGMRSSAVAVHPRWRGEHQQAHYAPNSFTGSSPLARGTQNYTGRCLLGHRFIPAGAGNTSGLSSSHLYDAVHPRWRGEHSTVKALLMVDDGSSPLARGTPDFPRRFARLRRFIPAGAGNTPSSQGSWSRQPVHPRWRGEHNRNEGLMTKAFGSSPLARGTRQKAYEPHYRRRFIPAGAGNTTLADSTPIAMTVHPRWRGEHAHRQELVSQISRFIPAGAGNTR